jgi:hypothetical protein
VHQPDIYVNGSLLNKVYFTIVKQLVFEANPVFSPRTHKCRVGAGMSQSQSHRQQPLIKRTKHSSKEQTPPMNDQPDAPRADKLVPYHF